MFNNEQKEERIIEKICLIEDLTLEDFIKTNVNTRTKNSSYSPINPVIYIKDCIIENIKNSRFELILSSNLLGVKLASLNIVAKDNNHHSILFGNKIIVSYNTDKSSQFICYIKLNYSIIPLSLFNITNGSVCNVIISLKTEIRGHSLNTEQRNQEIIVSMFNVLDLEITKIEKLYNILSPFIHLQNENNISLNENNISQNENENISQNENRKNILDEIIEKLKKLKQCPINDIIREIEKLENVLIELKSSNNYL